VAFFLRVLNNSKEVGPDKVALMVKIHVECSCSVVCNNTTTYPFSLEKANEVHWNKVLFGVAADSKTHLSIQVLDLLCHTVDLQPQLIVYSVKNLM